MNGLIAIIIGVLVVGLFQVIVSILSWIGEATNAPGREREAKKQRELEEERWKQKQEKRQKESAEKERKRKEFIDQYKNLNPEEILLRQELRDSQKLELLITVYSYSLGDARELLKNAERVQKKARLNAIKRKVNQKAQELYGNIPANGGRTPIPDEVKMFVWQRDGGKCVKCAGNESLEFDHMIPISKGGSNTERNIQLLCETCNRSKSDEIC